MRRICAVAALAAIATITLAGTAGAQTDDTDNHTSDQRTITVSGTGQVRGIPDVMELSIGVDTRAHTAAEALSRNSDLAHKVQEVLAQAGISKDDLQTSNLSVYPVHDDDNASVIAYSVTNTVEARIHDLGKAGEVVDAATKVASDEIVVNGLYFSFDDNADLVSQARADAVKRARAQATELAKAAGVELGDLVTMSEDSSPSGPPVDALPSPAEKAGSDSTPIQPGADTLSVDVTMVYEIR